MLYYLHHFADDWIFFNLFQYITFRAGGAIFTAMLIVFLFGGKIIDKLRAKQGKGQPIREDGPESHFQKRGTPTMGGLMILGSWLISTLLWADLTNAFVWAVIFVTVTFGIIGFTDDYAKVMKSTSKGVSGKMRLLAEFIIAIAAVYIIMIYTDKSYAQLLFFPFLKDIVINLGLFFIPFAAFVIAGSANAVNLTDGLDGLAIVPVMIAAMSLGLIAYLSGRIDFANYLQIAYTPGTGELAVLCTAILGAGLGFLWYNAPPADIFMGDTGSLALGGMLGTIGVATKHEIVLAIIGGLFVLEAVSVIVQVISFKTTGKRVFRMAPIHHHFEKKGWKESQVVVRFWIIAVILALIGLASLKLR